MILGSQTFRTFNRLLPGRSMIVYTRNIEAFRQSVTFEVVEVTAETKELSRDDVLYATSLPVTQLAQLLQSLGKEELAICGGSSIYAQWVEADLVETLYLTIEPVVFGKGVPLFSSPLNKKYQLQEVKQLSSQTLLVTYKIEQN
jgi:dihydrofolate reductase